MKKEPLYKNIIQILLRLIATHYKDKSYILPSETQLCLNFNISRITAKRALNELKKENYLLRKKGYGSYINPNLTENQINNLKKQSLLFSINEKNYTDLPKIATVIIPNLNTPYYSDLITGINKCLEQYNWILQIALSENILENEINCIKRSLSYSNGLIISPLNYMRYNKELIILSLKNFPLVIVDNSLNGLDITSISSQNFKAIYDATKYFIDQGKKNIAYITFPEENNSNLEERRRGYESALIDNKIKIKKEYIFNTATHIDIVVSHTILKFLTNNPEIDAIITANCGIGKQTLIEITNAKIYKLLDNVIIFDDEFLSLENLLKCKIKYIKQDAYQIGYLAAKNIIDQYYNPTKSIKQSFKIETHFYSSK